MKLHCHLKRIEYEQITVAFSSLYQITVRDILKIVCLVPERPLPLRDDGKFISIGVSLRMTYFEQFSLNISSFSFVICLDLH